MSTPTPSSLPQSKPTPGRGPTSAATPSAASPPNLPPHGRPQAGKSPYKPHGGTASTTHTPMAASSPIHPESILHGLGRTRAGTLGASAAGSKNTPGSQDAGTPAGQVLGGLGMGINMGFGSSSFDSGNVNILGPLEGGVAMGRSSEAIARRTRDIIALLGQRWGRVSQDGLVACGQRLGLDGMWEDGMGSGPGSALMRGKNRTYIIAGRAFSVEVEWAGDRVRAVVMDLTPKKEAQREGLKRAGEILKRDLVGWEGESERGEYVGLERFAMNMEQLSRLDTLGIEKASCFEALDGIYSSLNKLWEWEVAQVKEHMGEASSKDDIEMDVTCQRSGRPAMHEGKKIGHRIDYWVERRTAATKSAASSNSSISPDSIPLPLLSSSDTIFSLLLSCQPAEPNPYSSIRVTEDWIAPEIAKNLAPNDSLNPYPYTWSLISWQEPPSIALSAGDEASDPMDIDATIRQSLAIPHPPVRFVAKLDPPVTLPFQSALEIHNHLNLQMAQEPLQSYISMLFPEHPINKQSSLFIGMGHPTAPIHQPTDAPLRFQRVISAWENGKRTRKTSRYTLFTAQNLYGRTLTELPFAHPNQLVAILPVLRQWAYVGSTLRRSMGLEARAKDGDSSNFPRKKSSQIKHARARERHSPPTKTTYGEKKSSAPVDDDIPSDTDSEADESRPPQTASTRVQSFKAAPAPAPSEEGVLVLDAADLYPDSDSDSGNADAKNSNDDDTFPSLPPVDISISYPGARRVELDIAPLFGQTRGVVMVGGNAKVDVEVETEGRVDDTDVMDVDSKEENEASRVLAIGEDLGLVRAWMEMGRWKG